MNENHPISAVAERAPAEAVVEEAAGGGLGGKRQTRRALRYVLLMRHQTKPPTAGAVETQDVARTLEGHRKELAGKMTMKMTMSLPLILSAGSEEAKATAIQVQETLFQEFGKYLKRYRSFGKKDVDRYWRRAGVRIDPGEELTLRKVLLRHGLAKIEVLKVLETEFAERERKERETNENTSATTGDWVKAEIMEAFKRKCGSRCNTVLVVGHQPLLSWIAHALTGTAYPLVHSEILCLEMQEKKEKHAVLRWALSPSDDALLAELKDKVKSKMQLAGLLSGFISAGLGFFLGTFKDKKLPQTFPESWAFVLGAVLLLLALILYFSTVCGYDSLLMPKSLWADREEAEKRPAWVVARPPSSARWIIYQNMLRIWYWQFIPATYLLVLGLASLGIPVLAGPDIAFFWNKPLLLRAAYYMLAVAIGVLMWKCWRMCRRPPLLSWRGFWKCDGTVEKFHYVCGPWLGSED